MDLKRYGKYSYSLVHEGRFLKTLFRFAVVILVAIQLFGPFFPFPSQIPLFVSALVIFVAGFPLMSRGFRVAALLFLILAFSLLGFSRQPFATWVAATNSMTNIIAIVAVMQTFSMPIRLGTYDSAIRAWVEGRFKSLRSLFAFTTLVTHLLTSFLNLGSVPVVVSLFGKALGRRVENYERFISSAATRGYVLAALWSPGAVNLFLVVQATGLSWSRVFLPGFFLAIIGMGLSSLFEFGKGGVHESKEVGSETPSKGLAQSARAFHVFFVALAFVLLMLLFELLDIGAPGSRMILAGASISLVWLLSLAGRPGLAVELRAYWREGLLKTADIGPFFVAMGLFSGALEHSGAMDRAAPFLEAAASALGGGSVVLVGLLIVAGSLIGLHPFITIVLFGKILAHSDLPVPPLTVAMGLAVGGAAAYMVTPFAGVIMTLSKLIGARAFDVAFRWNWRFGILFFGTGMAFAFLWGGFFG
ncbi:MAG TPA: hypothetical protein VMV83_09300 [Rectinemataceae bacterium]|nr:hypothetical protein [Rectinemataceae bacterium]